MDPPARRRVGSWCLTRSLLGVKLSPGRQENQHPERPISSFPTHIQERREDPGTPTYREWYRQTPPEPSRAPCPTLGGNQTSRLRAAQPPLLFPTLGRDLVSPFSTRAPRTASPLGQMPRDEPRALRPFPSPRWWQRRPWMASPLTPLWTVPPGSVPPQPGRFWAMGLSTPHPAGPSKEAAG